MLNGQFNDHIICIHLPLAIYHKDERKNKTKKQRSARNKKRAHVQHTTNDLISFISHNSNKLNQRFDLMNSFEFKKKKKEKNTD